MPLKTPAHPRTPLTLELALPPPFVAVRLRELGDAFAHATAIAVEQGAGTLVYVGRFDLAEFAVVLEPEEPLAKARRAFYAGMAAPAGGRGGAGGKGKRKTWTAIAGRAAVLVRGGVGGGGRLAGPQGKRKDETPPWLV